MSETGLQLQPADIACWELVGEMGCLDTATIHSRVYPALSLRGCQRRLKLATDHGYLRRAALAVCFRQQVFVNGHTTDLGGAVPVLHTITDKAADVVERATGVRPMRILRSEPAAATFLHRWQVVHYRLAFDDALVAASLPAAKWVMEQDPWPQAPENLPPNQRRMLYHRFAGTTDAVTCQPDAACLIQLPPQKGARAKPLVCLWEIDRSTEGLKQIERKLPGYAELLKASDWRRYFSDAHEPTVRVFWICQSPERIAHLRKLIAPHEISPLCRFALARDMTAAAVLLAPVWQTVGGEKAEVFTSAERR